MKIKWAKRARPKPARRGRGGFSLFHARPGVERPHPQEPKRHKKLTFVGDEGRPWRRAALIAGIVAVLALIATFARAEPQLMSSAEIQGLQRRGVLKVGVRSQMPGMAYENEGLELELAALLAERLLPEMKEGNGLKLVEVTSGSVNARLSDGSVDVVLAMMPRGAAATKYAYSDPYYRDECVLAVATGATLPSGGAELGCVQDTAANSLLSAYIAANPEKNYTIRLYGGYDDMLKALTNGRVGGVAITRLALKKYQGQYDVIARPVSLGYAEYALTCPIDSPAFASVMDILLTEMKNDGSLAALYEKYGLADGAGLTSAETEQE